MSSTRADFALLLGSPDPVEAALAKDLLSAEGIPSMLHGQDRDLAELGAGHAFIARPDLLVPKSALVRAREVLIEAWGDQEFP
ncbi:MAG: putative signal transducing protein [Planctomycetota bacterium]